MAAKYDWASVDWTLSTTEIATQLGTALSVVSRARKKFAQKTVRRRMTKKRLGPSMDRKNKKYDWKNVNWSLSTQEISYQTGAGYNLVSYSRRLFAPETVRKITEWEAVDWTKTDVEIAKETEASPRTVSHVRSKYAPKRTKKSMSPRMCRECGKKFEGGPRAWYCPLCREKRKIDFHAAYLLRRREGLSRGIGTFDHCAICGGEYVVQSGNQKYCPACAPTAIAKVDRKQGMDYYMAHRDEINPARNRARRENIRGPHICVICGQPYSGKYGKGCCSNRCLEQKKQLQQAKYDAIRRNKQPPPISLCDAEKLGWDALGRVPDSALAKIVGVSHTTVRKRREKSGISPCVSKKTRVDWAKFDALLLSSDASAYQMAKRIGCDVSTVRERRRFLHGEKCKYSKEQ